MTDKGITFKIPFFLCYKFKNWELCAWVYVGDDFFFFSSRIYRDLSNDLRVITKLRFWHFDDNVTTV